MTRSPGFSPSSTSHLSPIASAVVSTRVWAWPAASTIMATGRPASSRVMACCGARMAWGLSPSATTARTYMPGSSTPLGLGKMARSVTAPVVWSTVTSVNCSLPFNG